MVWTLEYVLHPSRPDNMSRVKTTERFFKRFLYTVIINIPPTSNEEKQSLILSKNDISGLDKVYVLRRKLHNTFPLLLSFSLVSSDIP